jgi:hypothetical protein
MTDFKTALETDLALSERQVWKHHGLSLEQCRDLGMTIQSALIAPTVHRKARHPVQFVMLEPLSLEPFELRHLAGVAEMRRQLQAETRDWQVIQHAAQTSPDAIWWRGLETWAVEFDAGSYSRSVLLEKARAFQAGFDGQVWGVSSTSRTEMLSKITDSTPVFIRPF